MLSRSEPSKRNESERGAHVGNKTVRSRVAVLLPGDSAAPCYGTPAPRPSLAWSHVLTASAPLAKGSRGPVHSVSHFFFFSFSRNGSSSAWRSGGSLKGCPRKAALSGTRGRCSNPRACCK